MQNLIQGLQKLQNHLNNRVHDDVGTEAVTFYKSSFDNQGFTDEQLEKWTDVKRRTNPGRTARAKTLAGRPILTGDTGDLKESIHYEVAPPYVEIHADKEYAQVHNEGGKAGRKGRQFDMPQRKFIGKSATFTKQMNEKLENKFNTLLNHN